MANMQISDPSGLERLFVDRKDGTHAEVVVSVGASELALGRIDGIEEDTKFGCVTGIDAADNAKDVWDWASDDLTGADTKTFPTSAATLYIASDNAGDTSISVQVGYIDGNGARQSVVVTTDASDGTTPVSLGVSGLDVNRAFINGDGQSASGNLYIQQGSGFSSGVPSDASAVLAFIRAGDGQTQQAIFTVPNGFKMHITGMVWAINRASGAAGSATCLLKVKTPGGSWLKKRRLYLDNGLHVKTVRGLVFEPGTKVVMHVQDVSDGDTNVTGELQFNLVEAS